MNYVKISDTSRASANFLAYEGIKIKLGSKMLKDLDISPADCISFYLKDDKLFLKYLGVMKVVPRASKIARVRKDGFIISRNRLPEILNYIFGGHAEKVPYEVIGEELAIDLSSFKKPKGFSIIKNEEPVKEVPVKKKGFGSLSNNG